MNNLLNYFLSTYANEPIEIQKKIKAMIIGSISMFSILFTGAIMQFALFKNYFLFIMTLFVSISFLLPLLFIKSKKDKIANGLFTVLYLIGGMILFYFNDQIVERAEVFSYSTILLFGLLLILLVSITKRQVLIYVFLAAATLLGFYFYKVYLGVWSLDGTDKAFGNTISGAVIIIFGGLLASSVIAAVEERVKYFNEEALRNRDRFIKITELIESSKSGMAVGENLIESTDKTLEKITDISSNLQVINGEITSLDNEINISRGVNSEVAELSSRLKSITENFNVTLTQSSTTIEELTVSIQNISQIFNQKSSHMAALAEKVKNGEEEMIDAAQSVKEISNQTESLFEIISVIQHVADRTDLLAMNAAIEAAHAGDAGKGFAVVADEIRKLAEQTNENLKIINASLNKNIKDIQNSVEINTKAADMFHDINNEIDEVKNSIDEVNKSMVEISYGTKDILNGVNDTKNMFTMVTTLSTKVDDMSLKSRNGVENLTNLSKHISAKIKSIIENFSNIVDEAQKIKSVGIKNKDHIEIINSNMEKFKMI